MRGIIQKCNNYNSYVLYHYAVQSVNLSTKNIIFVLYLREDKYVFIRSEHIVSNNPLILS